MAAGQCRYDPATGIAGEIYSGWLAGTGAGLASGVVVSGSVLRNIVASQVEAVATAIENHAGTPGGHSVGTSVVWLGGSGAGKISFPAFSSGTLVSATGCDEGGTVTFTTGGNTFASGVVMVHFAQPFSGAPAVTFYPGDVNSSDLFFLNKTYATSTSVNATLNIRSAPSNSTYTIGWIAKGATNG